ncbi:MAG: twin-arginine translocation signal domain-containing protein [Xanthobacteraceae bacterium]
MSHDQIGKATRRDFLGTATAATALTLGASSGADAQNVPVRSDEIEMTQVTTGQGAQLTASGTPDWTKPTAMAIPKEGYFKVEQGRYGPIFPRTPANYGFTVIVKVKPGREQAIRDYGQTIEDAVKGAPGVLAPLRLHYLRWVLFDVGSGLHFMYQGIFDTDFDKYLEDAIALFNSTGITTVFVNLEGWPEDWKTNTPAVIKFFRDHQRPSFLEYGEYPYASADEVKKALRVKSSLSAMLDQMQ